MIDFQDKDNIHDVLKRYVNEAVQLQLKSGQELGGFIKKIGPELLYLSQITGREFFDAIIKIEDVTAVIIRVK